MEPNLPAPHGSPETGPRPLGPEIAPPNTGEFQRAPEKHEVHEQKQDAGGGQAPQQAPVPAAPVIVPTAPQPVTASIPQDDTNPPVAADEDVIEKEWVEKAKKVIAETKHDPYLQEQAVSLLQADYLQKRYGKNC